MKVLAIDPGPTVSGLVFFGDGIEALTRSNHELLRLIDGTESFRSADFLAIEEVTGQGRFVGRDELHTMAWAGRFIQQWLLTGHQEDDFLWIPRANVKKYLLGRVTGSDTEVRAAITDRFGGKEKAIGRNAKPGPLHRIKGHEWAALAVALTAIHEVAREAAA